METGTEALDVEGDLYGDIDTVRERISTENALIEEVEARARESEQRARKCRKEVAACRLKVMCCRTLAMHVRFCHSSTRLMSIPPAAG
jgi:hypothetical protein